MRGGGELTKISPHKISGYTVHAVQSMVLIFMTAVSLASSLRAAVH